MRSLLIVVGLTALAHADEPPAEPPAPSQPWAVGVSEERKERALALLKSGNEKLADGDYVEALAIYQRGIGEWDHPAIRFNIVRCLIQLDRLLDAVDNLERALAYGPAPLEETVYTEALTYKKLLATQIGDIEVSCDKPGPKITLDGTALDACPMTITRRVRRGAHQIIATRDGYVPFSREVMLLGGDRQRVAVELVPVPRGKATIVKRRWSTWIPWTVFGAGLGVVGIGTLIEIEAARDMDAYDRNVTTTCGGRGGCTGDQRAALDAREASAVLESQIGIGVLVVGAATVIAGSALLYWNRPITETAEAPRAALELRPTRGGATVGLAGSF